MASEDRFKQSVIATLAKRAANRCANPDCGALTSGPSEHSTSSVNVGEAAHIFGANPGSARYDEAMVSADRSAITNAIWLCGNCHKLIDDDPVRYPSGLLFEWQREHEKLIGGLVGKAGAEARRRFENRRLEEFGRLSYLAERIILDKPDFWEYRLTTEVLRYEMAPFLRRWAALKRKLYAKPSERVVKLDALPWTIDRITEIQRIAHALGELMNVEFDKAWGAPGVAGDDQEIVSTCRLFAGVCESALIWEEVVRFTNLDSIFNEVQGLFVGLGGRLIDEAAKVPKFLAENLGDNPEPGEYRLSLVLDLPEGWNEAIEGALERATAAFADELS